MFQEQEACCLSLAVESVESATCYLDMAGLAQSGATDGHRQQEDESAARLRAATRLEALLTLGVSAIPGQAVQAGHQERWGASAPLADQERLDESVHQDHHQEQLDEWVGQENQRLEVRCNR